MCYTNLPIKELLGLLTKRELEISDLTERVDSLNKEFNDYGRKLDELEHLFSMLVLSTLRVLEDMETTPVELELQNLIYTADSLKKMLMKK